MNKNLCNRYKCTDSAHAIECFEENNLVLPLVVLEELDGLEEAEGEKGANARAAVRKLQSLQAKGDLLQGVKLTGGGILRIKKTLYRSNSRRIFRTISRITES